MDAVQQPIWAEVNLAAITENVQLLKGQIDAKTLFMAVVKADGYGHGAAFAAKAALEGGADWLGVARVEEGLTLHRAGLKQPILVLGLALPSQWQAALKAGLRLTVTDEETLSQLGDAARSIKKRARIHLKVETGMGRLGASPEEAVKMLSLARLHDRLVIEGIFSHFATADSDLTFAKEQCARFQDCLHKLDRLNIRPPLAHMANSAGILFLPQGDFDMVRAGVAIYGLSPTNTSPDDHGLVPALSLTSRVTCVRELPPGHSIGYGATYKLQRRERIAIVSAGYGDGYTRRLMNPPVLIGGSRCQGVGRICMDQMMVRVPDHLQVQPGDEVKLIGQQGHQRITAEELAQASGTINYEIVCSIAKRVPRLYVHHPSERRIANAGCRVR